MSDHLDRDTGERMLRGEDTGPRPLAALLAAASAPPRRHDKGGEEAAVAAFRAARAGLHGTVPVTRRLLRPRILALKAVVAGLLLALAGGAALAAPHLASSGHRHARTGDTSATTSGSTHRGVPVPPHASPVPSPPPDGSARHDHHGHGKHGDHGKHAGRGEHDGGPGSGGDGPGLEIKPSVQVPLPTTPLPGQLPSPLPGGSTDGQSHRGAPSLSAGV